MNRPFYLSIHTSQGLINFSMNKLVRWTFRKATPFCKAQIKMFFEDGHDPWIFYEDDATNIDKVLSMNSYQFTQEVENKK